MGQHMCIRQISMYRHSCSKAGHTLLPDEAMGLTNTHHEKNVSALNQKLRSALLQLTKRRASEYKHFICFVSPACPLPSKSIAIIVAVRIIIKIEHMHLQT